MDNERLIRVEESTKSAHKRIDQLEDQNKVIYKLATNMEVMAEAQKHQQCAIDEIKDNLAEINSKPGKWVDLAKSALIGAFFTGVGAAIVALLLKGGV